MTTPSSVLQPGTDAPPFARSYGVYRPEDGTSERALFVLDAAGVIRWSFVSPVGINPGTDGILDALDQLAPASPSRGDTP